jgi:hypothetical protein
MERNLHETTSRWKTYGKWLFSEDIEVRDGGGLGFDSGWWRLIPWCVGGGHEVMDRRGRWAISSLSKKLF